VAPAQAISWTDGYWDQRAGNLVSGWAGRWVHPPRPACRLGTPANWSQTHRGWASPPRLLAIAEPGRIFQPSVCATRVRVHSWSARSNAEAVAPAQHASRARPGRRLAFRTRYVEQFAQRLNRQHDSFRWQSLGSAFSALSRMIAPLALRRRPGHSCPTRSHGASSYSSSRVQRPAFTTRFVCAGRAKESGARALPRPDCPSPRARLLPRACRDFVTTTL